MQKFAPFVRPSIELPQSWTPTPKAHAPRSLCEDGRRHLGASSRQAAHGRALLPARVRLLAEAHEVVHAPREAAVGHGVEHGADNVADGVAEVQAQHAGAQSAAIVGGAAGDGVLEPLAVLGGGEELDEFPASKGSLPPPRVLRSPPHITRSAFVLLLSRRILHVGVHVRDVPKSMPQVSCTQRTTERGGQPPSGVAPIMNLPQERIL